MSETVGNKTENNYTEELDKALKLIEEFTSIPDEIQKQTLENILSSNANVEYIRRYGLNGHTDRETFKKTMPVVSYEDMLPDVDRIANGDTSRIICSNPISEFLTSSGTSSGEKKLIPITEEEFVRRLVIFKPLMLFVNHYFPSLTEGKGMNFMFIKSEFKTPGGLVARPLITRYFKSSQFHNTANDRSTSPKEAILCPDYYQSMYSQLLCGLCQNKQVFRVGSIFAPALIRAIKFLEQHWSLLCNDIKTGNVDTRITDQSVRESVMKILKPDPELANFIEAECSKGSWDGIITRLWPNTKFLEAIVTGTMSQYIPTLDYYSNGLPIVSLVYASSECHFGVNLNPICNPYDITYTLIPTMAYFEFLPAQRNNDRTNSTDEKEQKEIIDLVDVKLGQEYEVVITNYAGLYRYRVGDVLRVAGFKNKMPQFNFVCRKNVVLSVESDRTDEVELQKAVNNAVKLLVPFEATLVDYTSYVDVNTIPGHYVLFLEIKETTCSVPDSVYEDCCLTMEESFNGAYRQGRVSDKSIGPLEIKVVATSTFDKLMDFSISMGASFGQYKTPRCVKFAPSIELLNSRVVRSYVSPKCPTWIPGLKT